MLSLIFVLNVPNDLDTLTDREDGLDVFSQEDRDGDFDLIWGKRAIVAKAKQAIFELSQVDGAEFKRFLPHVPRRGVFHRLELWIDLDEEFLVRVSQLALRYPQAQDLYVWVEDSKENLTK